MTIPFETISFKNAIEWAEKEYKGLNKCPECNNILEEKQSTYSSGAVTENGYFISNEDYIYCSEWCAEKNIIEGDKED